MNDKDLEENPQELQKNSTPVQETPALWVEGHLRIFDPETKQQIVNTRA